MLKFILVKLLTQNYFENVLQALKSEAFARFEFVPVEYCDVKHVKQSFKKLMRACTPSTTTTDTEKGLLGNVHESDWLQQIQVYKNILTGLRLRLYIFA